MDPLNIQSVPSQTSILYKMRDVLTSSETAEKFNLLDNQSHHLLTEYKCNNIEDHLKIAHTNSTIQNQFASQRTILQLHDNDPIHDTSNFRETIFQENYVSKHLRCVNYDSLYIAHNKNGQLKNHIWIRGGETTSESLVLDEIILNVNYTIISDTLDYKYKVPESSLMTPN